MGSGAIDNSAASILRKRLDTLKGVHKVSMQIKNARPTLKISMVQGDNSKSCYSDRNEAERR